MLQEKLFLILRVLCYREQVYYGPSLFLQLSDHPGGIVIKSSGFGRLVNLILPLQVLLVWSSWRYFTLVLPLVAPVSNWKERWPHSSNGCGLQGQCWLWTGVRTPQEDIRISDLLYLFYMYTNSILFVLTIYVICMYVCFQQGQF